MQQSNMRLRFWTNISPSKNRVTNGKTNDLYPSSVIDLWPANQNQPVSPVPTVSRLLDVRNEGVRSRKEDLPRSQILSHYWHRRTYLTAESNIADIGIISPKNERVYEGETLSPRAYKFKLE